MAAIALDLTLDQITPALDALAADELKRDALMAAGTLIESYAVRAFDEPGLRPKAWLARKKSKATNPLLIKSGNLRQGIHTKLKGSDAVEIGNPAPYAAVHQLGSDKASGRGSGIPARPYFPALEDQLTGNVLAEIGDAVAALIGEAAGG